MDAGKGRSLDNEQISQEVNQMNATFENLMDNKDVYLENCKSETEHIENQGTLVVSATDTLKYFDTKNKQFVTLKNKSAVDTQMFSPQFENSQNFIQIEDMNIKDSDLEVEVTEM